MENMTLYTSTVNSHPLIMVIFWLAYESIFTVTPLNYINIKKTFTQPSLQVQFKLTEISCIWLIPRINGEGFSKYHKLKERREKKTLQNVLNL